MSLSKINNTKNVRPAPQNRTQQKQAPKTRDVKACPAQQSALPVSTLITSSVLNNLLGVVQVYSLANQNTPPSTAPTEDNQSVELRNRLDAKTESDCGNLSVLSDDLIIGGINGFLGAGDLAREALVSTSLKEHAHATANHRLNQIQKSDQKSHPFTKTPSDSKSPNPITKLKAQEKLGTANQRLSEGKTSEAKFIGGSLAENGHPNEALVIANQLLSKGKTSDARFIGISLAENRHPKEALQIAKQLLRMGKTSDARFIGNSLAENRHPKEALQIANQLLRMDKTSDARFIGISLAENRHPKEALQIAKQLLRMGKTSDARFIGDSLEGNRHPKEAIDIANL